MNVKSSLKCEQCDAPCETISHIFYECPAVKSFWVKIIDWWNRKRKQTCFHIFNHYLVIARYYVYLARN